jgi:hypothetical protein
LNSSVRRSSKHANPSSIRWRSNLGIAQSQHGAVAQGVARGRESPVSGARLRPTASRSKTRGAHGPTFGSLRCFANERDRAEVHQSSANGNPSSCCALGKAGWLPGLARSTSNMTDSTKKDHDGTQRGHNRQPQLPFRFEAVRLRESCGSGSRPRSVNSNVDGSSSSSSSPRVALLSRASTCWADSSSSDWLCWYSYFQLWRHW